MTAVAGVAAVGVGGVFLLLGGLTLRDLVRFRGSRRSLQFGIAFGLVALTLAAHSVVLGLGALAGTTAVDPLIAVTLLAGLAPGIVFLALRFEAGGGGRGERSIRGTPRGLRTAAWVGAIAAGAILAEAADAAASGGVSWLALPAIVLAAAYATVGVLVFNTQVRRRAATGGWSLSGLSLAGVFLTAGLMEAAGAATSGSDPAPLAYDVAGVPAAVLLLWTTWRICRSARSDWTGRPAIRVDAPTPRSSPWARAARS